MELQLFVKNRKTSYFAPLFLINSIFVYLNPVYYSVLQFLQKKVSRVKNGDITLRRLGAGDLTRPFAEPGQESSKTSPKFLVSKTSKMFLLIDLIIRLNYPIIYCDKVFFNR